MVSTTQSLEYVNINIDDDEVSVSGLINEMQSDNETGYSSTDSEDEKEEVKTKLTGGKAPRPQLRKKRGRKMIVDKKAEKKRDKEEEKAEKKREKAEKKREKEEEKAEKKREKAEREKAEKRDKEEEKVEKKSEKKSDKSENSEKEDKKKNKKIILKNNIPLPRFALKKRRPKK